MELYLSNDTCRILYTAMRKTVTDKLRLAKYMALDTVDKIIIIRMV